MMWVLTVFLINATEAPVCDNLYTSVDSLLQTPAPNSEEIKKEFFKISNEKRSEVLRFGRLQKDIYRKTKEQELTSFDAETKKNKNPSAPEKANRRKEREVLSLRIQAEKKEFNKNIDASEQGCLHYLKQNREKYLAQIRDLQKATKVSAQQIKKTTSVTAPELDEFKDIPKGPGTVLKPQ